MSANVQALQEKCCATIVEVSADMTAVVVLAEQSLDLDRTVTKREQALLEMERKLHAASSAVLSAQHSTLAKAEKTRQCREEMGDAKK